MCHAVLSAYAVQSAMLLCSGPIGHVTSLASPFICLSHVPYKENKRRHQIQNRCERSLKQLVTVVAIYSSADQGLWLRLEFFSAVGKYTHNLID